MAQQLTWLSTVLQKAGLKVAEVPGWQNRGRPKPMGTVKGVMCHHTAGPASGNMPTLNVLVHGHGSLPGPLSQLGLARDGTYYVVAAGRCNHAGKGEWRDETDGNGRFIGIEAENTGKEPWPDVQLDAYRRGVAAILAHLGASEDACCGHKEFRQPPGAKSDPHSIDMDAFRGEVKALMTGTGPIRPPIKRQDARGRPTLRRDQSSNPEFLVEEVQGKLGLTGLQRDGRFGPTTEARVRQFQRDRGLVPDGIVGPLTWEALDRV